MANIINDLALIFPGQGSQYIGMAKAFYDEFDIAKRVFDSADKALGFSLSGICFYGPQEKLNLTEITQPAILTASIAIYEVFKNKFDVLPSFVTGHSLGEYSALVASGAIDFKDAVKLVNLRGKFMQEAVPVGEGAMCAVLGFDEVEIEKACLAVDATLGVVSPANFNSPGQVVISGSVNAVNKAVEIMKSKGAKKVVMLPVSAPFHCALMKPAADNLAIELGKINISTPQIKSVSNVNANFYSSSDDVKTLLIKQVTSAVKWVDCLNFMIENGAKKFVEVGPGKVLTNLVKRANKDVKACNVEKSEDLNILEEILRG